MGFKLFGFRKRMLPIEVTLKERELLERELAESADSAMPNSINSDSFGDGSSINNISKIQATLIQQGMDGIVGRRIFEPRKGWSKNDREQI